MTLSSSKEVKIPVYIRGNAACEAIIDAVNKDRFSKHRWSLDASRGIAYRDSKNLAGKNVRIYMMREVLNCKKGDGKTVVFKSDDRLDCRLSNLSYGRDKRPPKYQPGKFFPGSIKSFLSYMSKHHDNTPVCNFVELANIETYSTSKVTFAVEEDMHSSSDSLLKMQDQLRAFFESEFGYLGKVDVIRQVVHQPSSATEKTVPLATAPVELAVAPAAKQPAVAALKVLPSMTIRNIGQAFGFEMGEAAAIESLNFAIRHNDKIHSFSYGCRPANETHVS